MAVSMIQQRN